ncbi:hypothetical protein EVAR_64630_1 [Eumeta japonica]|uniref:Uncharacterized protein n=1 Tax=Eumeta variegata TaxID=151549 RepID=A0A4C1ZDR6_EUMVA|nr:hypothetical protein EVAR_64630_1 [Eumeta japonica]
MEARIARGPRKQNRRAVQSTPTRRAPAAAGPRGGPGLCNHDKAMLQPIWLQYENKLARPARYHTPTAYRRKVTASAVTLCESFGGPLPPISLFLTPSGILFLFKKSATH